MSHIPYPIFPISQTPNFPQVGRGAGSTRRARGGRRVACGAPIGRLRRKPRRAGDSRHAARARRRTRRDHRASSRRSASPLRTAPLRGSTIRTTITDTRRSVRRARSRSWSPRRAPPWSKSRCAAGAQGTRRRSSAPLCARSARPTERPPYASRAAGRSRFTTWGWSRSCMRTASCRASSREPPAAQLWRRCWHVTRTLSCRRSSTPRSPLARAGSPPLGPCSGGLRPKGR